NNAGTNGIRARMSTNTDATTPSASSSCTSGNPTGGIRANLRMATGSRCRVEAADRLVCEVALAVDAPGDAEDAFEGAAEGSFRFVAGFVCDGGQGGVTCPQALGSAREPAARCVADWRVAGERAEAGCER